MDQAAQGKAALSSGDFNSAISHYTNAISQNSKAVDYYIQRSTAYTRITPPDHQASLTDAEHALILAENRGKRELIASSQLRRAIALFGLERWADSKQCLQWVKKLNDKEKSVTIWEMKADGKLKGLEESDERAKVIIKETPDVENPRWDKREIRNVENVENNKPTSGSSGQASAFALSTSTEPVQTPADKIRSDWFQTDRNVFVWLFVKGIPRDRARVRLEEELLEITFPLSSGSDYDFTLDPLYSKIDLAQSSSKIMQTKVEFILEKATHGVKWPSLERTGPVPNNPDTVKENTSGNSVQKDATASKQKTDSGPVYPTSSKSGPKNWDKVAADLTTKPKKKTDDGDDAGPEPELDDDIDGDPVNGFFKKLFKDADPDTKRAMMKSYQESNGTALSTNWAEVSKKPVETSPPDGMEAKKWEG